MGGELCSNAVGKWGAFPELLEVYRAFLAEPFTPVNTSKYGGKGRLYGRYSLAADGLSRFGVLAKDFIPLVKERMAQLNRKDEEESGSIGYLTESLERLEGKRRPINTVNLKSQHLGVSHEANARWEELEKAAAAAAAGR